MFYERKLNFQYLQNGPAFCNSYEWKFISDGKRYEGGFEIRNHDLKLRGKGTIFDNEGTKKAEGTCKILRGSPSGDNSYLLDLTVIKASQFYIFKIIVLDFKTA